MINCEAISSIGPLNPVTTKDHASTSLLLNNVLELDERVSLFLYNTGLKLSRRYFQALEYSGDGRFWLPATAAMWLAPFENVNLQTFLLNLFLGFLLDLLLVGVIKHVVQRPRPVYNKGMGHALALDHWSFPSGHSTRSFFIAAFSCLNLSLWTEIIFPQNQIPGRSFLQASLQVLSVFFFLATLSAWAVATASSRILLGRHYLMDVVLGSIIGISEAFFVFHFLQIHPASSPSPPR